MQLRVVSLVLVVFLLCQGSTMPPTTHRNKRPIEDGLTPPETTSQNKCRRLEAGRNREQRTLNRAAG